ncbi:MAG: class I SAM-dependent methyltransferase [Thermodesulfobacteriaceae bacterium]|nr:class I SAM-dependent methyltransferase [Thermodesulfobacteriaceae bacterium]MCX8042356.1 class I SAM-dependent methyltransferase [Thermodesulfobacteriaceae bacterium]MDW8135326.1 class I SAM-dependent methyltransferase [Thermodesulfobacterium sp.]
MAESKILREVFWEKVWQEGRKFSTAKIKTSNYKKWIKFWNLMSEFYDEIEKDLQILVKEVIEVLKKEGLIFDKSVVLEIGCGPGTFTIPLSYEVEKVVALDPAPKMLDKLRSKIDTLKVSNIELIQERWETTSFDQKFDLVLAAFCPAINNSKNLLKMKEISQGYACLINYAKLDNFTIEIRNKLWKLLTGKDFISQGFHIIYPFGVLYAKGFRPQLKVIKTSYVIERKVETLIKQYENYFEIFTPLNKKKKLLIKRFFQEKATNDKLVFNNHLEVYVMWW